jgi:diguanylate cyclase (GGDEF)-like protein/PAS domain S-box-containing protein
MSTVYEKILNASRDFITLVSRDYVYEYVNESYCREIGLDSSSIMGRTVADVWGKAKFENKIKRHLDECFTGLESHDIDRFLFGQEEKYAQVSYYPYREGDEVTHAMVYTHDISALKDLQTRIINFEYKDSTTGLFNRRSFDIVLDMELEKARRSAADKIRAILFVNLRNFTQINARYGYEVGDLLLEATGMRIKDALRSSDYVFRFEGNDLAVILTTMKHSTDLSIVAENIRGKAFYPYTHQGAVINIGCNIGASVFPEDGNDKESLVRFAMSAMEEAQSKDEPLIIFNKELHRASLRKAKLRSDMRTALVAEQFEAHFQPVVNTAGIMVGAEALIRWNHPEMGNIPPMDFIPLAEESGDTIMIGRWMLYQVCKCIKKWGTIIGDRYISVNLSAKEFAGDGLVEYITRVLESEDVSPEHLKLEITETQSMSDIQDAIDKIHRLAAIGIEVLIDDFGAGYSSLAYIKQLPARVIKIDKCFVDSIAENEEDRAFLAGMIGMIISKGKEIIVEGVSSKGQRDILLGLGVERLQGFYFSKPVPAKTFEKLLRRKAPLPVEA